MRTAAILGIIMTLALLPMIQAQQIKVGICINDTYLQLSVVNDSGDLRTVSNIQCPYGCIGNSSQYGDDCKQVETENINYNLVLFAIGMLGAGILWNIRRGKIHPLRLPASIIILGLGAWLAYTTMIIIGVIFVPVGIALILFSIEDLVHSAG